MLGGFGSTSSLYARIVVVNVATLLAVLLLLLLTPVTVSAPVSAWQALVLGGAMIVMALANAALLKITFNGLTAIVQRIERIKTLDVLEPRIRLPRTGSAETRAVAGVFNAMLDRLERERRESTRRAVAGIEDERKRISRELHDEIGQRMTGVLLQLSRVGDEVPSTAQPRFAALRDEVRATLREVGELAWRIRPAILDDLGLLSALQALADSFGSDGLARITVSVPRRIPPMASGVELAIYRVAQEALTNAVRHSGASVIVLEVQISPVGLLLRISDNGRGADADDRDSPGLRGMSERAVLVGGTLCIENASPHGLRVELAVPSAPPDR